jgi:ATP-dependent helicase/DNAse subunit B
MTTHLYVAPAAAGKTTYVLTRARAAAQGLAAIPRVVVPTHLQARAARRRLAEMGGAIGVRVLTFDQVHAEVLSAAGEIYTELSDPVQFRLIRAVAEGLALKHYAPLAGRPGFTEVLMQLIGELKAAGVHPEDFAHYAQVMGDQPRLTELGEVYSAYQARLQMQGWADRAGLAWLAVEALEQRAPHVGCDWPLLAVDGFDSFTSVQVALLQALAPRVGELAITLSGETDGLPRPLVHRRCSETRARLEAAFGVQAEPLPRVPEMQRATLASAHLADNLFRADAQPKDLGQAVELIEAPDRLAEVRAALRWLKARLVQDRMRPGDVALVARTIPPYRPYILQTAAEFGLPIVLVDGLPLRENPAIVALLDLLRLALPSVDGQASLPLRLVVDAWRSPYFDWQALPAEDAAEAIGIGPGDADALRAAATWGRVIGGLAQWEEALTRLATRPQAEDGDDEERGIPAGVPAGPEAAALLEKLRRFVLRLTPPEAGPTRAFVAWLEQVIGEDPALSSPFHSADDAPTSLRVVANLRRGPAAIGDLDVAALRSLKDILRGLVWADEAVAARGSTDFPSFFADLAGAVDAATYRPPLRPDRDDILVADIVQARGLSLRAVALLGLAEGEFPARLAEDPFLREADRRRLREDFGLPVASAIESAESEFFYEALTRARERLLLTRPRLADDGAPWQASPFWEETRRLLAATPQTLTTESVPTLNQVASWVELVEALSGDEGRSALRAWAEAADPERWRALETATRVLAARQGKGLSPYDGDLSSLAVQTAQRFGPDHVWSASRLETYRACPLRFFIQNVLGLEPRPDAVEGLDVRQRGTIYHRILELVYRSAGDPSDVDALLAALPEVARQVLDEAPESEGFRATAWWSQTRVEMVEHVRRSLIALAELPGDFRPVGFEERFWGDQELRVLAMEGEDAFRLHGVIDRIDQAADGRLRVIDYKTGGPSSFKAAEIAKGKKLQLPLYALAARDALRLGVPVDGFYWHIEHAQASEFTLASGAEVAMARAAGYAWEAVDGVRRGRFAPLPPADGCPDYCPAAGYCWRYRPKYYD